MSADELTTRIAETGGGATKSASPPVTMLVCDSIAHNTPVRGRVNDGGPCVETQERVAGSMSRSELHAQTAGIRSHRSAWISIIGRDNRSSSPLVNRPAENVKILWPRSQSAISCAPTAIASEPEVERGRIFCRKSLSDLLAERVGSLNNSQLHQGDPLTTGAKASAGRLVGSPFGAILEPGRLWRRKHTRSCRCALARRRGGMSSDVAHTNAPVYDHASLPGCDVTARAGFGRLARALVIVGNLGAPSGKSEFSRGLRATQILAFGRGAASPSCGSGASRRLVASAMTSDSCNPTSVVGGYLRTWPCASQSPHIFLKGP
jgi:hypothetical protein